MRGSVRALIIIAMLAIPAATTASSAIIFSSTADGSGSSCVGPFTSFPATSTLYVLATTYGLQSGGITGAEFSITGLEGLLGIPPAGKYMMSATPSPAATAVLGDPLAGGVNIAYPECQTGGFVLLYTLQIINFGDTELRELHIAARQPPSNPSFNCPAVTLCDVPNYTMVCVTGGFAYLNVPQVPPAPTNPVPADSATGAPVQVTLQWYVPPIQAEVCELGTIWQDIYFGTDPNPPYVNSSDGNRSYAVPYRLVPLTRYYWRVTAGPNSGPVWSFTTAESPVGVESRSWTQVRRLYR